MLGVSPTDGCSTEDQTGGRKMQRLANRLVQVPSRVSRPVAWYYMRAGAYFMLWRKFYLGLGAPSTFWPRFGLVFGANMLLMGLGSLRPEEAGGRTLRGATRWLSLPLLIGAVL